MPAWLLEGSSERPPRDCGALCALVTTCPVEPLKHITDDKAGIQGKFLELMSKKELTSLYTG